MSTQYKLVGCLLTLCVNGFSQSPVLPHRKTDWNNITALARAAEVRVELSGSRSVRGAVINVTEDSLAVNSASGQETFTRQQVRRVSVRKNSKHKQNALAGLVVGAGAIAALGGLVLASCGHSCGHHAAASFATATLSGAGIGAAIGAAVPSGGWREIYRQ